MTRIPGLFVVSDRNHLVLVGSVQLQVEIALGANIVLVNGPVVLPPKIGKPSLAERKNCSRRQAVYRIRSGTEVVQITVVPFAGHKGPMPHLLALVAGRIGPQDASLYCGINDIQGAVRHRRSAIAGSVEWPYDRVVDDVHPFLDHPLHRFQKLSLAFDVSEIVLRLGSYFVDGLKGVSSMGGMIALPHHGFDNPNHLALTIAVILICIATDSGLWYHPKFAQVFVVGEAKVNNADLYTLTGDASMMPGIGAVDARPLADRKRGPILLYRDRLGGLGDARHPIDVRQFRQQAHRDIGLDEVHTHMAWEHSLLAQPGDNVSDCIERVHRDEHRLLLGEQRRIHHVTVRNPAAASWRLALAVPGH
ncbi:hypothetical protein [Candidatus Poriferisocius sp.]|uniref:hypothetical protein n=1 Tax=Candidatus Poriferisocius sp. TaxID=3101276 RepID=UPI003B58B83C